MDTYTTNDVDKIVTKVEETEKLKTKTLLDSSLTRFRIVKFVLMLLSIAVITILATDSYLLITGVAAKYSEISFAIVTGLLTAFSSIMGAYVEGKKNKDEETK
jgi:hypothetical protein